MRLTELAGTISDSELETPGLTRRRPDSNREAFM
jgi:hypothetical protein